MAALVPLPAPCFCIPSIYVTRPGSWFCCWGVHGYHGYAWYTCLETLWHVFMQKEQTWSAFFYTHTERFLLSGTAQYRCTRRHHRVKKRCLCDRQAAFLAPCPGWALRLNLCRDATTGLAPQNSTQSITRLFGKTESFLTSAHATPPPKRMSDSCHAIQLVIISLLSGQVLACVDNRLQNMPAPPPTFLLLHIHPTTPIPPVSCASTKTSNHVHRHLDRWRRSIRSRAGD